MSNTLGIYLESGEDNARISFEFLAPRVPWHVDEIYLRPGWGPSVYSDEPFDRVTLVKDLTVTVDIKRYYYNVPAPITDEDTYSLVVVDANGVDAHPCQAQRRAPDED